MHNEGSETITKHENFNMFKKETSSNGFNALDWAHNRKKNDVVDLLKQNGCKYSQLYKKYIKNIQKAFKQKKQHSSNKNLSHKEKVKPAFKKNSAELSNELLVQDFFAFSRVVKQYMYLDKNTRKPYVIELLYLSVRYSKACNVVLLNECGLLDFIKNINNIHNFYSLINIANINNNVATRKQLLEIFSEYI